MFVLVACGDNVGDPRDVTITATVAADGLSDELAFAIPDGTRSITIVVEGATDALYALGALALGDRVELVGLPAGAPGAAMESSYTQEQVGQMPGGLFQSIRLGTFTHVYPYKPGQALVTGSGRLRVASNQPGPVTVRIVMPEDDGAAVLPLRLYLVSDTLPEPDAVFEGELATIFGQAGISPRIDSVERLVGTPFERITKFSEPQEAPLSQSAMVTGLVTDHERTGLDVFFVEGLPFGVAGLSLGTPGPPIRGSYYYGVIVRGGYPSPQLARLVAHEVAHFLALQHVTNRGVSGMTYPDPIDDTEPGTDNLMTSGTVLTPGQGFALTRSALLVGP